MTQQILQIRKFQKWRSDYEQNPIQEFLRTAKEKFPEDINSFVPKSLSIATCQSCGKYSLWVEQEMVYPRKVSIEPPNEDLNEEIKAIYKEAILMRNTLLILLAFISLTFANRIVAKGWSPGELFIVGPDVSPDSSEHTFLYYSPDGGNTLEIRDTLDWGFDFKFAFLLTNIFHVQN